MRSPIERFFVIIMGFYLLIPTIPIVFTFLISLGVKNKQSNFDPENIYAKNTHKSNENSNTEQKNKPQLKIVTTEGYMEFNNILKSCMQNKLLTRETVLKLKCELRYRLGTHIEVYKNFEFQNDLHEIYTLSKSSVLTKDDYMYLTQFISNNLNFPSVG
jgi:hypothetical protein